MTADNKKKILKQALISFVIFLPLFFLYFYFFGKPKNYKTVNANNIYYISNPWGGEIMKNEEALNRKYMGFHNGDVIGCVVDVLGEGSFSDNSDIAVLKFKYFAQNCWGDENKESAVEFHCDEDIPKKYFNKKCLLIGTVKNIDIKFLTDACAKGYASVDLTNVYFENVPATANDVKENSTATTPSPAIVSTESSTTANTAESIGKKWDAFWTDFTNAFKTKDKKKIVDLTAKDFYAGGGASETVTQWLDSVAFNKPEIFELITTSLKEGTRDVEKATDGSPLKATGKGEMSGELFFIYRNDQWQFGGIAGD